MKPDLSHLSQQQQDDLQIIVDHLVASFQDHVMPEAGPAHIKPHYTKPLRIKHIILHGSYADPDVKEHAGQPYRILIVGSRIMPGFDEWSAQATKELADKVYTPVSLMMSRVRQINKRLKQGNPVFQTIRKQHIVLYTGETSGASLLLLPSPEATVERLWLASTYFEQGAKLMAAFMAGANYYRGMDNNRLAAFMLHQVLEHAYDTLLLTYMTYRPALRDVALRRVRAEALCPALTEIWHPSSATKAERHYRQHCFHLISDAYSQACWAEHYKISPVKLADMMHFAHALITHIETACKTRIEAMQAEATPKHG